MLSAALTSCLTRASWCLLILDTQLSRVSSCGLSTQFESPLRVWACRGRKERDHVKHEIDLVGRITKRRPIVTNCLVAVDTKSRRGNRKMARPLVDECSCLSVCRCVSVYTATLIAEFGESTHGVGANGDPQSLSTSREAVRFPTCHERASVDST